MAMPPQFVKAAAAKKAGAKKASPAKKVAAKVVAKKVGAKKANPFKAMSDAACPPGSMSGGMGTSKGMGAVKKAAAKKAMGEVGVSTPRGQRNAVTAKTRANKKLPSQSRINPPISGKGSNKTSGSDVN